MDIDAIELRRVSLPLVAPFRTAHGTETRRDLLLVRVRGASGEGWGECAALAEPTYTPEYVDGAHDVTRRHLVPRLLAAARDGGLRDPGDVAGVLGPVQGHRMAKAAVEMAVLDLDLRTRGVTLAAHLGAVRDAVDAGVAVGILPSLDALVATVAAHVAEGYRRVKLKIEPGFDVEPVRAVRAAFPGLALQVDANGAYTTGDADHLAQLDDFDLLLIEEPLAGRDLRGHAELATRLRTPICLDESIESAADAVAAIESGACAVVNVKAGRVGGYLEARRVHDVCRERGVPVWCGGMLESGLARAANVALAALPGFTLPGDLSASARWFAEDLTEPFVLDDGRLRVPTTPGIGREPRPDVLAAATTSVETIPG